MLKRTLLALALASSFAHADEGMWMPQQLPDIADKLKVAGLQLDPNNLTELTEFPMGAVVSLGGCSASFVSPEGLVVTNHHCAYGSIAYNSTPENNILANGFLAKNLSEELPAAPGSRIFVTTDVRDVSSDVIDQATAALSGRERVKAIENNSKRLVAECESDAGYRCDVSSFYGGLSYYLIKQLEIKDVRLVHAPAEGVGKFGGDTDNWMWPRHTGDYSFYRAYVGPDGESAEYSEDNVPYQPKFHLSLAQEPLQEGDFVMALGYPGRTNRHRLPSEVEDTFTWSYPNTVSYYKQSLDIIAEQTANNKDAELKYASRVAGLNNYMKNRQGMLDSYADSDMLARKQAEHKALTAWVNSNDKNRNAYADSLQQIESLLKERQQREHQDHAYTLAKPRLFATAQALYRLAEEQQKPDAEREVGYQARDLPRFEAYVRGLARNYDSQVEAALDRHFVRQYLNKPAAQQHSEFNKAMGLRADMSDAELRDVIDAWYANSVFSDVDARMALLQMSPAELQQSQDPFIKAAAALYPQAMAEEKREEELAGKIQQAYANYMRAKIAYMNEQGEAVYPDANSTLRVTYGNVKGRDHGTHDGTAWTAFTTLRGIQQKATGEGEFDAPDAQLEAIAAKNYGDYFVPSLNSVPVNFLATLDITGGNSGSAVLNGKGELVGLAFDGTLDSIISDWDFNVDNTRSIQLDSRYMLWQMSQVDGAQNLLKEMGVE
ncbi:S46 family peptidase [Idiomarina xiamenensis]|uniref:Dipeptidyl-peptidase n=1 Tax=Idiomarina xiamenensis 10-D-4 TaxID=740709 RepID=K2LCE9_9GAMM|nr:S46 family peptidase [Idiomarina xiamenensis]EKE87545.1 serine endoprotease [Idiomarina xiamenensis 10-D-4]